MIASANRKFVGKFGVVNEDVSPGSGGGLKNGGSMKQTSAMEVHPNHFGEKCMLPWFRDVHDCG